MSLSSLSTTNKQPQKVNQLMNDSQASLIELADQVLTAHGGLPPHLRGEGRAGVVVKQCLEIYAPCATPEAIQEALAAVLERRVTEMAA